MAPLRYAAKFDPFLSLDCARVEGGGIWQLCIETPPLQSISTLQIVFQTRAHFYCYCSECGAKCEQLGPGPSASCSGQGESHNGMCIIPDYSDIFVAAKEIVLVPRRIVLKGEFTLQPSN